VAFTAFIAAVPVPGAVARCSGRHGDRCYRMAAVPPPVAPRPRKSRP
jgi:hypothetical protein